MHTNQTHIDVTSYIVHAKKTRINVINHPAIESIHAKISDHTSRQLNITC
jgi:hypothetical protein